MHPFIEGVAYLGWSLLGLTLLVLLLLVGGILVLRILRAYLNRVQSDILYTADSHAASTYPEWDHPPPLRSWRHELRQLERELEAIGFRKLVYYRNATAAAEGRINHHSAYLSPDQLSLFCMTFLTLNRTFLGMHLPLPRWTGLRESGWEIETVLDGDGRLMTIESDLPGRLPDGYIKNIVGTGLTTAQIYQSHQTALAQAIASGRSARPTTSKQQHLDDNARQHAILAAFMQEDFENLVDQLEQCWETGEIPEDLQDPDDKS